MSKNDQRGRVIVVSEKGPGSHYDYLCTKPVEDEVDDSIDADADNNVDAVDAMKNGWIV